MRAVKTAILVSRGNNAAGGKPDEKGLSKAWDQLASPDAVLGYAAVATLAAAPAEAVELMRANLRPAPVPTDAELDRAVGQLDAEAFADREKASADRVWGSDMGPVPSATRGCASPARDDGWGEG